ncbi:ATP-binding Cassette (ABC) Superfamily [Thraustotheca clavata]|uniref:ATP-binding Cassette (ABC) Superfamily n=1 Tax=Thraustotheca clavata TaxID=74557 RepID=A0A1W0A002_9STRA|nr:ATP-binding Cassette (ABC) Superfamily [Thraustotheca clavata]
MDTVTSREDGTTNGDHHFIAVNTPKAASPPSLKNVNKTMAAVPKIALTWDIKSVTVEIRKSRRESYTKTILKDVKGEALPGQMVVIMGPSGAGKSSLLDVIAGRNPKFQGSVLVNGQNWSQDMNRRACYVMQDDVFYATLTVREHLLFQADLRMGDAYSLSDRIERVNYVIEELGLKKCQDTQIGNESMRGLSGGERKRLSFATELLTNPSLLFVDEPTSGLDSFMAESVVLQLQKLAQEGRTVLATIHQPSSEIFALFDRLYLLSNGRTVYNGKASDSVQYFASIGYQCPTYMNPTDYFMRQIIILDLDSPDAQRVAKIADAWTEYSKTQNNSASSVNNAAIESYRETRMGLCGQIRVLCKRNVLRIVRDQIAFKARCFQSFFISIIVGLIYLQLSLSQTGLQSYSGVLFFISINQVFSSANSEFIAVPLELPIMLREWNAALYRASTWYLAKNISEIFFQAFFPMLFLIPLYFMIGFGPTNATVFFSFYLFLMLLNSAAVGLGYMVSCMVRRADIAPVIGIVIILPLVLFGGLFLNTSNTPDYFIWLEYISPLKYAYRGLSRAYWNSIDTIKCDPNQRCIATSGAQVLSNQSLDDGSLIIDVIALLAINVGFRTIGLLALARMVRKK